MAPMARKRHGTTDTLPLVCRGFTCTHPLNSPKALNDQGQGYTNTVFKYKYYLMSSRFVHNNVHRAESQLAP